MKNPEDCSKGFFNYGYHGIQLPPIKHTGETVPIGVSAGCKHEKIGTVPIGTPGR